MKKNKIYIVHSLYTIYLAILEICNSKIKSDIIILTHTEEIDYEEMREKLLKFSNINEVILVKDIKKKWQVSFFYPKKLIIKNTLKIYGEKNTFNLLSIIKKILKNNYIVISAYDGSIFFRKFFYKKVKYILLEDGHMTYERTEENLKKRFKEKLKEKIFGIYPYRKNKNIRYLYVLNKKRLSFLNKKIREYNYLKYKNSLSEEQKNMIINIFLNKKVEMKEGANLLLTQCFYQDGILKDYNSEIKMYKELIKLEKLENEIVYIKQHPRDLNKKFTLNLKNEVILPNKFPLEILELFGKKSIKKVISITSTAIDNISCCDIKIKKEELLKKYLKKDNNLE